jgi:hypothetical protein
MKRSLGILGILLAGIIVVLGCGGGGSPTSPPINGGPSTDLNLSGTWSGTVSDRSGSCATESFSVDLAQGTENANGFNGPKITGSFSTPCQGQFALQLFLNGNHVIGNIGGGKGHVDGVASASAVDFSVIQGQGGLEGGQTIVAVISMRK